MSSSTITVLTCDRCCHAAETRQSSDQAGWSTLSAADVMRDERSRMIGSFQRMADICPGCADLLFAWWEKREAVVQPAPASAETAPRRFTIEDKAEAIEEAKTLLLGQAEQALAAAREEPTSLLDGRMLPDALHSLDERARALVDMIVGRLVPEPLRLAKVAK